MTNCVPSAPKNKIVLDLISKTAYTFKRMSAVFLCCMHAMIIHAFNDCILNIYLFSIGKYIVYLETPYFIFVKDSLSYIILLGLHFALCVTKSTIPFSILEWIILVFFAGRIVNEISQFLLTKEERMILQKGDESRSWVKKQLRKYLR